MRGLVGTAVAALLLVLVGASAHAADTGPDLSVTFEPFAEVADAALEHQSFEVAVHNHGTVSTARGIAVNFSVGQRRVAAVWGDGWDCSAPALEATTATCRSRRPIVQGDFATLHLETARTCPGDDCRFVTASLGERDANPSNDFAGVELEPQAEAPGTPDATSAYPIGPGEEVEGKQETRSLGPFGEVRKAPDPPRIEVLGITLARTGAQTIGLVAAVGMLTFIGGLLLLYVGKRPRRARAAR